MKGETKTRAGFTAGPWKDRGSTRCIEVEAKMQELSGIHVTPIFANAWTDDHMYPDVSGDVVAFVPYFRGREDEANARLIASSPDILEALEGLVRAVDPAGDGDVEPYFRDPLKRARKAITKATGGDR